MLPWILGKVLISATQIKMPVYNGPLKDNPLSFVHSGAPYFDHVALLPCSISFMFCHFQCTLFSCCTFFLLYSFFILRCFYIALFSCYIRFSCCYFFRVVPFSCCSFFVLPYFHAAFFVLRSFHLVLSLCSTLFMLHCHKWIFFQSRFPAESFGAIASFYVLCKSCNLKILLNHLLPDSSIC